MDALTEDQKRAYVEHGGVHCPFCGSVKILSGPIIIDDVNHRRASARVECNSCDESWYDVYRLVAVEVED